jgi:hypothetical protein
MPESPANVSQTPEMDTVALSKLFFENRRNFPAEQLAPYKGKIVAWWPDGSRIFDADVSYEALFQRLHDAGHADFFFLFEPIPPLTGDVIDPFVALHMHFSENRNNFRGEELKKYGGMLVAWWPDGTRIVDVDTEGDGHALFQRLRDSGYDPSFFQFECLWVFGETYV